MIYSFDVGIHTGVCKVESRMIAPTLSTVTLEGFFDIIYSDQFNPELVILERMPSRISYELENAIQNLEKVRNNLEFRLIKISPSTWKPIAKAQGWIAEEAKTNHEYDAYCLYRYYSLFLEDTLWKKLR